MHDAERAARHEQLADAHVCLRLPEQDRQHRQQALALLRAIMQHSAHSKGGAVILQSVWRRFRRALLPIAKSYTASGAITGHRVRTSNHCRQMHKASPVTPTSYAYALKRDAGDRGCAP